MSWPTTRRYPRSLSEAFPDVRAPAIEVHLSLRGRLRREWSLLCFAYRIRRIKYGRMLAAYLAVRDFCEPEPF